MALADRHTEKKGSNYYVSIIPHPVNRDMYVENVVSLQYD